MSARILSLEFGYEGPRGDVKMVAGTCDVPDGAFLPDVLQAFIDRKKAEFLADDLPIQEERQ